MLELNPACTTANFVLCTLHTQSLTAEEAPAAIHCDNKRSQCGVSVLRTAPTYCNVQNKAEPKDDGRILKD